MAALSDNTGAGASAGAGGGGAEEVRPRRETRIIRYGAMGRVGEFSMKPGANLPYAAKVVVQTERGIELGEQVGAPCALCCADQIREQAQAYLRNSGPEFCYSRAGRILRAANEQDISEQRHLNAHVEEDINHCAEVAGQLGLDLKVVTAEHLLGGERIVFYFRSPTRVDFRQLVKELAQRYRTRIEMRQVQARDEACLVADYEICGRECCCKNFLKKLRPINMKMAKLQKSTLDPSKVSGRCGKLRCCLRYEHVGYEELEKRLPRPGTRVETEFGPATVLDRQILTQLVSVRCDDDRLAVVPLDEIKAFNLPPAPPRQEAVPGAVEAARFERRRGERPRRERPPRDRGPEPRPGAERPSPTAGDGAPAESRFRPEGAVVDGPPAASGTAASGPPDRAAGPAAPGAQHGGAGRRRRRRRRRPGGGGGPPSASAPGEVS
jgi:cell fate regulator YaaT (PSP1 superfamily)